MDPHTGSRTVVTTRISGLVPGAPAGPVFSVAGVKVFAGRLSAARGDTVRSWANPAKEEDEDTIADEGQARAPVPRDATHATPRLSDAAPARRSARVSSGSSTTCESATGRRRAS